MLVLSRHVGEVIMIGDNIQIKVVEIDRGRIRLGIDAPKSIPVHRMEMLSSIRQQEIIDAANARDLEELRRGKPHTF